MLLEMISSHAVLRWDIEAFNERREANVCLAYIHMLSSRNGQRASTQSRAQHYGCISFNVYHQLATVTTVTLQQVATATASMILYSPNNVVVNNIFALQSKCTFVCVY